jgi:type VI secretion system protein ImpF
MAPKTHERILQPSLIDRLIDLEPGNRKEAPTAQTQSLRQLKDSVRRDLEWLLNTRRTPAEAPARAKELWRSSYSYGLPDLTGLALNTEEARGDLARILETAIGAFEPRLRNATATLQPSDAGSRVLRFQIEALLLMEPAPARVYFDTTLELTSGEYQVTGERNAR